jgi:hypothetical protein
MIGYTDELVEESFGWIYDDGSGSIYTNWHPGEPNDFGSGEDYVEIRSDNGRWNDLPGFDWKRFLMEVPAFPNTYQSGGIANGGFFPVGEHTVEYTSVDNVGNETTCEFTVTVNDVTPPVLAAAPANVTVQCVGDVPAMTSLNWTDNCDAGGNVSGVDTELVGGACGGTITRTWNVSDAAGNPAETRTQTITVDDTQAPVLAAAPANVTVECIEDVPDMITLSWTDNCDAGGNVSGVDTELIGGACGGTITRTWNVSDACGNPAETRTQTITVDDTKAPVLSGVPGDVTVECDAVPAPADPTAADNCDPDPAIAYTQTRADGSCDQNYVLTRTWTTTDACGNSSSESQTVTVQDTQAPTAICRNRTYLMSEEGSTITILPSAVDDGSSDVCSEITLSINVSSFDCDDVGPNNVKLTVTDACTNSSTCDAVVTIVDDVKPTVTCSDADVQLDENCNAVIGPEDFASWSDNCGILMANVSPGSFTTTDIGANTVTVTVYDVNGNSSTCTATATVLSRPTTLTNLGAFSGQYSDYPELSAQLLDFENNPLVGREITFSLNGRTATAITDGSGTATTSAIRLDQAPGTYDLVVTFDGWDCYDAASDTDDFAILQEDARVLYTGTMFASTASVNDGTATILLSATVCDITNSDDANGDNDPGDISNATVTFVDREGSVIVSGVPVVPLPGDSTKGIATYEWTVDIGNNSESESFVIGTIVDNYYTRNSTNDDAVVTVSKPGCDFITGGGYIISESSVGQLAADDGSRFNFGFNIKFNRQGTNLQGRLTVIVRRVEADGMLHVYRIKGNRMTSLGFNPGDNFAEFTGKANVADVTDPDNPVSVFGNGDFRMIVTDNGEPGTGVDLIGLQLTANDGSLIFSSNWDGIQTAQQLIDGGNIKVHTCGNGNGARDTEQETQDETGNVTEDNSKFTLVKDIVSEVYPNPFRDRVTIEFTIPETARTVVEIFSITGEVIKTRDFGTLEAAQTYTFDFVTNGQIGAGTYHYRIISGKHMNSGNLILMK